MRRLLFLLLPAVLVAGQARYARLARFGGPVEIQLTAASPWIPAERNLALPELAWARTGDNGRVEIETDDGGVWRLGPDSQGEISDDTLLSTGQRVTILSLDHGLAYFTGIAGGTDSLVLAAPGAQVTLTRRARVRIEASAARTRVTVLEGAVRFSCPAAEIELREGQPASVEPSLPARFFLDREIEPLETDNWSESRDKALAEPVSGAHVPQQYGAADLDSAGEWIDTADFGSVWKPKAADGWLPFRQGRWRWYEGLGYTWVADEPWGWLPYHYGRWTRIEKIGWVWVPSRDTRFRPGDVWWLAGDGFIGWGPLAPGEFWDPATAGNVTPIGYVKAEITFAAFKPGSAVIDPTGFKAIPEEPLVACHFVRALASPELDPARLDAVRPVLRAGSTRVQPFIPGVAFESAMESPPACAGAARPPVVICAFPTDPPPPEVVETAVPVAVPVPVTAVIVNTRPAPGRPKNAGAATPPPPDRNWQPPPTYAERLLQLCNAKASPAAIVDAAGAVLQENIAASVHEPNRVLAMLYCPVVDLPKVEDPTDRELEIGHAAATQLLKYVAVYFQFKPGNVSDSDWAQARLGVETAARQALYFIAMHPGDQAMRAKHYTDAVYAYGQALRLYPESARISYGLAAALIATRKPENVRLALYELARAVVLEPAKGGLADKDRAIVDAYLTRVYRSVHGSETGLGELKESARKSPFPKTETP
jgi:hypothetical protein